MMRNKTCLVTGGSGFIGRFVIEELLHRGYQVINFDCTATSVRGSRLTVIQGDLRDKAKLQDCVEAVNEVYHFAGLLGTEELFRVPQEAIDVNLIGLVNLLEASARANVRKFFYPSAAYKWRNIYSLTKHAGEEICLTYNRAYNLNVRVLRLWNIYGPRQAIFPVRKAVPIFVLQALLNQPVEIFGNGREIIRLIYSADLAQIIVDFMDQDGFCKDPLDINPGAKYTISVRKLAEKIIDLSGSKSSVVYLPKRFGEFDNMRLRRLNNVLDLIPFKYELTELNRGLLETISYYGKLSDQEKQDLLLSFGQAIKCIERVHQSYE